MKPIIFTLGIVLFLITNIYSQIWTTKGNKVYLTDSTKNVGIGTTAPSKKLTISGGSVFINDSVPLNYWTMNHWRLAVQTPGAHAWRMETPTIDNLYLGVGMSTNNGWYWISSKGNSANSIVHYPLRLHPIDSASAALRLTGDFRIYNPSLSSYVFTVNSDGHLGIATDASSTYALQVCGIIKTKEVLVQTGWCDYVFNKDYKLSSLDEVEKYINQNKHLPDVPSAKEIETNGVKVGEMDSILIKKVEELTLYVIKLQKEINELKNERK